MTNTMPIATSEWAKYSVLVASPRKDWGFDLEARAEHLEEPSNMLAPPSNEQIVRVCEQPQHACCAKECRLLILALDEIDAL